MQIYVYAPSEEFSTERVKSEVIILVIIIMFNDI